MLCSWEYSHQTGKTELDRGEEQTSYGWVADVTGRWGRRQDRMVIGRSVVRHSVAMS